MKKFTATKDLPEVKISGKLKDGMHEYIAECINCDKINTHVYSLPALSFRSECSCGSSTHRIVV